MGSHLIDGQFQSDKYPTTPRGFVPLKTTDRDAQPVLWAYAQAHRARDPEFSADLETALRNAGFVPPDNPPTTSIRVEMPGDQLLVKESGVRASALRSAVDRLLGQLGDKRVSIAITGGE